MKTTFFNSLDTLQITLLGSAFVHAVLIAAIKFEPPDLKKFRDNLPILEVFLVNAKTQSKPDNAEVFAQANLDRGGNTEQNRKMKSALPALKQQETEFTVKPAAQAKSGAKAAKQVAEDTQEQKRVAALENKARELMTQINAQHKVESQTVQQATTKKAELGNQETSNKKLDMNALAAAALEMDRLNALIDKQQDEYQKRPKKAFAGSRVKEYEYALYIDAWRQKVEKIGTTNYPQAAKNQNLYGQLQMTVEIRADGTIADIEINRSSGHKILDEAAIKILKHGEPYAEFSDAMRKKIDILSITRTWTFTKEDSLATN